MAGYVILRPNEDSRDVPDINKDPGQDGEIVIWKPDPNFPDQPPVRACRDFNNNSISIERALDYRKSVLEKTQEPISGGGSSVFKTGVTTRADIVQHIQQGGDLFLKRALNAPRVPLFNPYLKRMDYSTMNSFFNNAFLTFGAYMALDAIKEMERQYAQMVENVNSAYASHLNYVNGYNEAMARQNIVRAQQYETLYGQQVQAVKDTYSLEYGRQLNEVGGTMAYWNTNVYQIGGTMPQMGEMQALFNKLTLWRFIFILNCCLITKLSICFINIHST